MHEHKTRRKAKERSDTEWVAALSGTMGDVEQEQAIEDLAYHLYVAVYNNLLSRRRGIALLKGLAHEEISSMAMDFTQKFMEKMVSDHYQLLDKYHGTGRFTNWATQVTLRLISSEFRRMHWLKLEPLQDRTELLQPSTLPEEVVVNNQLHDLLQRCIDQLPSRMQLAFIRRVIDGESAAVVAQEMGVSPNAINLLVHRAKKMLRALLADDGVGNEPQSLANQRPIAST